MDLNKLKGKYRGLPIDGGLGETSTGKEEVAIAFDFLAEELKGQRITGYFYFTDGTIESTYKALRACGWKGTELTDWLDFKKALPNPEEVELVIEPEVVKDAKGAVQIEADGVTPKMRARVRWVNPVGRMGLREPLAADKAAAFAARMKAKLLALDQQQKVASNNGAAAPASSTPAAPVQDPGDVPF